MPEIHAVVARVEVERAFAAAAAVAAAVVALPPPLPPIWQAGRDKVDHDDDQGAAEAEQAEVRELQRMNRISNPSVSEPFSTM